MYLKEYLALEIVSKDLMESLQEELHLARAVTAGRALPVPNAFGGGFGGGSLVDEEALDLDLHLELLRPHLLNQPLKGKHSTTLQRFELEIFLW
jgi:hypothetical protein